MERFAVLSSVRTGKSLRSRGNIVRLVPRDRAVVHELHVTHAVTRKKTRARVRVRSLARSWCACAVRDVCVCVYVCVCVRARVCVCVLSVVCVCA